MDYRSELYRLKMDRRVMAAELGLSYSAFNARLCGFTHWQAGEESRLRDTILLAEINRIEKSKVSDLCAAGMAA